MMTHGYHSLSLWLSSECSLEDEGTLGPSLLNHSALMVQPQNLPLNHIMGFASCFELWKRVAQVRPGSKD